METGQSGPELPRAWRPGWIQRGHRQQHQNRSSYSGAREPLCDPISAPADGEDEPGRSEGGTAQGSGLGAEQFRAVRAE